MSIVTILGLAAGALTTISFVPQVIKTLKTRKTEDLALWTYIVLFIGVILWVVYGFIIKDMPIIIANSISFILVCILLFSKLRYG